MVACMKYELNGFLGSGLFRAIQQISGVFFHRNRTDSIGRHHSIWIRSKECVSVWIFSRWRSKCHRLNEIKSRNVAVEQSFAWIMHFWGVWRWRMFQQSDHQFAFELKIAGQLNAKSSSWIELNERAILTFWKATLIDYSCWSFHSTRSTQSQENVKRISTQNGWKCLPVSARKSPKSKQSDDASLQFGENGKEFKTALSEASETCHSQTPYLNRTVRMLGSK